MSKRRRRQIKRKSTHPALLLLPRPCLFLIPFYPSIRHPTPWKQQAVDLRQPHARTFLVCTTQQRARAFHTGKFEKEALTTLLLVVSPLHPPFKSSQTAQLYQDTSCRRPIDVWSTSTAPMYAAQPNGADSATINPAALNTGASLGLGPLPFVTCCCFIPPSLRRATRELCAQRSL